VTSAKDDERIALFFATSGHSGVDRVVRNLLPEFDRSGRSFDLLQIRGHGPHIEEDYPNIRKIRLPAGHKSTALLPLAWYLYRHRPSAILLDNHRLNMTALRAKVMTRSPVKVCVRVGTSMSALRTEQPRRYRRESAQMRNWYRHAHALIAPSESGARDLQELSGVPRERVHAIANPVVNDRLYLEADEPVQHPWFSSASVPVITACGNLSRLKDHATLIRAFAIVRETLPCHLLILGEGDQRGDLERLARREGVADDVWMPGFASNPYRYMAKSSLFVHTSRREGLGMVIIEALALGIPVVATDCPTGPADILQQGRFGRLVEPGAAGALAEAILETLRAPLPGAFLRQAADRFRADEIARRYLDILVSTSPISSTPPD
jgi:glycosyltransferase involved in cell wall biosynthesis